MGAHRRSTTARDTFSGPMPERSSWASRAKEAVGLRTKAEETVYSVPGSPEWSPPRPQHDARHVVAAAVWLPVRGISVPRARGGDEAVGQLGQLHRRLAEDRPQQLALRQPRLADDS